MLKIKYSIQKIIIQLYFQMHDGMHIKDGGNFLSGITFFLSDTTIFLSDVTLNCAFLSNIFIYYFCMI